MRRSPSAFLLAAAFIFVLLGSTLVPSPAAQGQSGRAAKPGVALASAQGDAAPSFYLKRPFGGTSDQTVSVAAGDVNGDGALDIIAANDSGQSAVYLNDGKGNFNWPGAARLFGGGSDATQSVAVGDVNGDGALDIIDAKYDEQSRVYLNDGAGNFNWPGSARPFGAGSESFYSVAVGDVNGDGALVVRQGKNLTMC